MKSWLHAEDIGWPPKKTGEQLNAEGKIIVGDFAPKAVAKAAPVAAPALRLAA